jgi:enoyl-CoA hydratase/carnithine racemase
VVNCGVSYLGEEEGIMAFSQILFEKVDRAARITLNRPTVKNALSPQLMPEVGDAGVQRKTEA